MIDYNRAIKLIEFKEQKVIELKGENNYVAVKVFYSLFLLTGLALAYLIFNSEIGETSKGLIYFLFILPIIILSINKIFDGVEKNLYVTSCKFDSDGITYNYTKNKSLEKHLSRNELNSLQIIQFGRSITDMFFRFYLKGQDKPIMEFSFYGRDRLPITSFIKELNNILKYKNITQHKIDDNRIYFEFGNLNKMDIKSQQDFRTKESGTLLEIRSTKSSSFYFKIDFDKSDFFYQKDHFLENTILLNEIKKFDFSIKINKKPQELIIEISMTTKKGQKIDLLTNRTTIKDFYTDIIEYEKTIRLESLIGRLNSILKDYP